MNSIRIARPAGREIAVAGCLLTALFALAAPAAVAAQAAAPPTVDSLAMVVVLSLPDDLRRRAGQSAADEQAARQLVDQARQEERRLEALIGIQKSEIQTVDKRMDLAKKEKRDADRKTLEGEKKALELRLRMMERWRDVHIATVRASELAREAARKFREAAEAELQLLDLRAATGSAAPTDSAVRVFETGQQQENLIRQTRRVLESRRDEAETRRQLADRQRDLAEKQLQLLEAQLAVRAGKN
jgi:hypothetical protein